MQVYNHKRRITTVLAITAVAGLVSGCNIIGAIAGKAPKPDILAAYKGLAGKSVGIMVYVDPTTKMNFPGLQLDLANSVDYKLQQILKQDKDNKDLSGTTFPVQPRSIARYQRENPGLEAMPVTDVAPKLQVERLIYIQVNNFATQAEGMVTMYLGTADVTMQVIEIGPDKTAKVAYTDPNIRVKFPRSAPAEGELSGSHAKIYTGTVDELSTQLSLKFFKHPDYSMGVGNPDAR